MTIMPRNAAKFWWGKELPDGVAYVYHNGGYHWPGVKIEWIAVTYKELLEKKIKAQGLELWCKRRSELGYNLPGYVWVFKVPGFIFGGWWIYIKTAKRDIGISFRHEYDKKMILKAMELYPCGMLPLMENFDKWAVLFSKQYAHVGFKRKKNQGLAKVRVYFDKNGDVENIELL